MLYCRMVQEQNSNQVAFDIGDKEPKEFLTELHEAIAELKKLAFSHTSVDMDEDECHAVFVLSDFQVRLVGKI